ncbi:hypothetical protein B0H14DRAFT_99281 [Mycena olivaceomarginata]|nr:hypothetical protein B0H14DRAFT_99281 [Mycena olivaceomarginata]
MPAMRSRSRSVTSACSLIVFKASPRLNSCPLAARANCKPRRRLHDDMGMEMDTGWPVRRTYPFPAALPAALLSRSLLTRHLQRRRCLKVKSDAQARSEPCACPSSAARPRLQRALSRHALHARRSPSRLDPTSSSGRFQLYTHPARPLHLRSVDSACTSPLTPEH